MANPRKHKKLDSCIDGLVVREESKHSHIFISMAERREVLKATKANAVLAYMYYAQAKYTEEYDFSDEVVASEIGLAKTTVRDIRLILIDAGFLAQETVKGMRVWFVGKYAVMYNKIFPGRKLDNYSAWKKLCTEFSQELARANKDDSLRIVYSKMQATYLADPEKYS